MTVTVLVLDSVGLGALPDASDFGDAEAHTLDHTLQATGVELPNFARLGLGCIAGVSSVPKLATPSGAFGRMAERSPGKDTTTGHWEFMGVILEHAFRTFAHFPDAVMEAFDAATGRGHLGNRPASGTVIIEELGSAHLESGDPIVYTSADSVFQVASHTGVVPLTTLYTWCEAAREILQGEYAVARVIARPFEGEPGSFVRIGTARRDYSLRPPHETVLDALKASGHEVVGIGKIPDIYSHQGFTREVASKGNMDGVDRTVEAMRERQSGLVFTNLVEFDSLYGHRRDPEGYARALAEVDERLPELLGALRGDDVLLFASDHGNDPTWVGSDHTREYGLLLAYSPKIVPRDLGTRESFADLGATVANLLGIRWSGAGESFAELLW